MAISLALLAYKEADNLRVLLPELKKVMDYLPEEYEIFVVDTQKALDDTEEVCKENGVAYYNQRKPYFGGAFRDAVAIAKYDKFLILDSDGSIDPHSIPKLYKKYVTGKYDVVIGSRYIKGGKTDSGKLAIFMSWGVNTVFRIIIGTSAKDISINYRIYDTKQLKATKTTCDHYDIQEEVLLRMKKNNKKMRIGEVPIQFKERLHGESKRRMLLFAINYFKSIFKFIGIKFNIIK